MRVAGETVRADCTSASRMHALPEQPAHALTTVDALAVVAQHLGEAVDRLDQGSAVRGRDVLVEGGVTLGQAHHASKSGAAKRRIRHRSYRLRVRDADGEGQVAQKRHLPVVRLGGENLRPRTQGPNESEPLVERGQVLPVVRREDPGLATKEGGIAFAQATPLLAGDGVAAEKSVRSG